MNMEFPSGFMAPHEGVQNQILDINVDYITSGCFIPTMEQQQSTSTFAETFNRSRLTYPCKLNTPTYPYNLNMNMNQDFNLGIEAPKPNAATANSNPAALSLVNKPKGKSKPPQQNSNANVNNSDIKSKGSKSKSASSSSAAAIANANAIATAAAGAAAASTLALAAVGVGGAGGAVSAAPKKLTCDICFKSNFSEMKYLKRHMQLHSVGTPYKCELCSKHYKAARYLVVHMKLVHRDDIPRFNCELCSKSFKEKYKLRRHTQRVHAVDSTGGSGGGASGAAGGELKPYKCTVASCLQSFSDETSLLRHVKAHTGHSRAGGPSSGSGGGSVPESKLSFPCELCRKEFRRKINLQTHMKTKHGRDVVGSLGGGGPSSLSSPLEHHNHAHNFQAGKHTCQLCMQPFYCKSDFDQHLRSEPEKLLNWFKCPLCSKLLNSQCLLTQHSKMHQKNHKECHPPNFNQMDLNRINLKIPNAAACSSSAGGGGGGGLAGGHYGGHNNYSDLNLGGAGGLGAAGLGLVGGGGGGGGGGGLCPEDYENRGGGGGTSSSFKDSKPKRYECSQCRKYLWSSNDLKVHIANFHGGDKPFQCDKCPKRWAIKKQLTEHMRSHSNDRPFTCDICHLVSFKWRTDLNKHRRKYHPR